MAWNFNKAADITSLPAQGLNKWHNANNKSLFGYQKTSDFAEQGYNSAMNRMGQAADQYTGNGGYENRVEEDTLSSYPITIQESTIDMSSMMETMMDEGENTEHEDGKIYLLGRSVKKLDPKSDKLTSISFSAKQDIDLAAEREFMFDYVKREEGARFYNTNMHGVDWEKMTESYRKFLPHINNNYDFAEMLSELLGELNVSHTGSRYYSTPAKTADRTASLGLLYDMSYTGDGLKVAEIIAGGPFDKSWTKLTAGAVITKINGTEINAETDQSALFNNIAGKKTLVTFKSASDGSTIDEVIVPIPCYALYRPIIEYMQAKMITIDTTLNNFQISKEMIKNAITNK